MIRRRVSNRVLSGTWAHLNGRKVAWEGSDAPASDNPQWARHEARIVRVGNGEQGRQRYYVRESATGRWIDESSGWQRDIRVIE